MKYVSKLQNKYLTKLGYVGNIQYVEFEDIINSDIVFEDDYLVSVYALGEFMKELQDFYVSKVDKILHYYLIWNSPTIHERYLNSEKITDEVPKTGEFNKTIINGLS